MRLRGGSQMCNLKRIKLIECIHLIQSRLSIRKTQKAERVDIWRRKEVANFEVFMAVKTEFVVFWVVTPCNVVAFHKTGKTS
jgi:hypothetical protein